MERIDYSRKGQMMNIKENFYIYLYKHNNTLIDEQKIDENNHSNILFDIAIQYTDTYPHRTTHAHARTNTHTLTLLRDISSPKHVAQNTTKLRPHTHTRPNTLQVRQITDH
jgi:hypothetical protein